MPRWPSSVKGRRAAPECQIALMPTSPEKETSLTLMMRVQQDPADPLAWDEFAQRYQPIIRAWCLRWGAQPSDADDEQRPVECDGGPVPASTER